MGTLCNIQATGAMPVGGKIDPSRFKGIGHTGGPTYTRTNERFDMIRPK
jgi:hypothetical protein